MSLLNIFNQLDHVRENAAHIATILGENQMLQLELLAQETPPLDLIEAIAIQNAQILSVHRRHEKSLLARIEALKAKGVPAYVFNYPYCVARSFEDIKALMAEPDSTFDNTPADIDKVLDALSARAGLHHALQGLDQFTLSHLSEAVWHQLREISRKHQKDDPTVEDPEPEDDDDN